ncbi:MAG: hypothetical protein WC981_04100 [Candidatus Dojkabacteria bacterium]
MDFQTVLSIISISVSTLATILVIIINLNSVKKIKEESKKEREEVESLRIGRVVENTEFSKKVINKLSRIEESQGTYSRALLHILRTDLLTYTDEIFYINRKRNTRGSKWVNLQSRLDRYNVLEEVIDNCFESYKSLGGNCYLEEKYNESKAIIKETKKQAEYGTEEGEE